MAEFFSEIDQKHRDFMEAQAMFFVATAPSGQGRISLSPKGLDTFRILGPNQAAYLDITGSGNETAAHLKDNGRITIMFCSFTRNPLILRLYGHGRSVQPGDAEWDRLIGLFKPEPGIRQIILMNVESLQTSCGYGVPLYELVGERDTLARWAGSKTAEELADYRLKKNSISIDGLPTGLKA